MHRLLKHSCSTLPGAYVDTNMRSESVSSQNEIVRFVYVAIYHFGIFETSQAKMDYLHVKKAKVYNYFQSHMCGGPSAAHEDV